LIAQRLDCRQVAEFDVVRQRASQISPSELWVFWLDGQKTRDEFSPFSRAIDEFADLRRRGHGEDNTEMGDGQQFGAAVGEPLEARQTLALRSVLLRQEL